MARRKSTANAVGDIVSSVLLLGAAGVVVYLVYELAQTAPENPSDNSGLGPIGPLNQLDNAIFPQTFPGGGEVPGTVETYTGAQAEATLHPIDTLTTLIGGNPATTATTPRGSTGFWSALNPANWFLSSCPSGQILSGGYCIPAPQFGLSGLRRTRRADGWR